MFKTIYINGVINGMDEFVFFDNKIILLPAVDSMFNPDLHVGYGRWYGRRYGWGI